jgi:integrase
MVRDRRTGDNPLAHLSGGNAKLDRRHDRRSLPAADLQRILDAAWGSTATFRGLDGRERHHVYLIAMTTGFRAEEVASLAPESFALDADPPTATLPARVTKNKNTATQPLPADVALAMREYLRGKPFRQPLWPGNLV